ncbi:MAG: hypothetical protein ACTTKP_11540, partial [Catonella sp.]|uniref:hypothetical protein n=1 Tax=Catonella sp. TaxID=2382125 RepID=UPI003FA15CAE
NLALPTPSEITSSTLLTSIFVPFSATSSITSSLVSLNPFPITFSATSPTALFTPGVFILFTAACPPFIINGTANARSTFLIPFSAD